ncbi:hypothetical protein P3X46_010481, partial [Hevea brasiliensis]
MLHEEDCKMTDYFIIYAALHESVRERNADNFIDALERISAEKKVSLSTIFNQLGPSGNTLLHMATSSGNEEISQLIAYHFPSLISKKNGAGDTALHIAARSGMLYTIQILVCCGKDFHGTGIASDLSSFTSENDFAESTGDDGPLRTKNVHGNTALHEAVLNRHHDVAQFLISADPQVWNYQNKDGWSPLYMAVKIGDLLIFRLLLQSPARNTDSLNNLEGSPPAHATIIEGKI